MNDGHHSDSSHTNDYPGDQSQIGAGVINQRASFSKQKTTRGDGETNTVPSSRDRLKRQTGFDPDKVLCPLELVATHKFHNLYGSVQNSILFLVGDYVMMM